MRKFINTITNPSLPHLPRLAQPKQVLFEKNLVQCVKLERNGNKLSGKSSKITNYFKKISKRGHFRRNFSWIGAECDANGPQQKSELFGIEKSSEIPKCFGIISKRLFLKGFDWIFQCVTLMYFWLKNFLESAMFCHLTVLI